MAPKENLFLVLKGLCDCFHMVGQHGDKHDELRPGSIWLVPRHCPSTAVILHPNIWVIARYAWELSALPILGIPHWQHAPNSRAPLLLLPCTPTSPPSTPTPLLFETLSHSRVLLRHLPFLVSVVATQREKTMFCKEGEWSCKSWVFSTSRIGVKCNKILYVCQK